MYLHSVHTFQHTASTSHIQRRSRSEGPVHRGDGSHVFQSEYRKQFTPSHRSRTQEKQVGGHHCTVLTASEIIKKFLIYFDFNFNDSVSGISASSHIPRISCSEHSSGGMEQQTQQVININYPINDVIIIN